MKKNLLLLIFVFVSFIAKAQWYAVPDTNFRKALDSLGYSPCMNAAKDSINSNCSLVQNTRSLNLFNRRIHRLDGILAFGMLNYLDCSYNTIDSIGLLPDSINFLKCSYCQTSTFGSKLPKKLTDLHCNNNYLGMLPPLPDSLYIIECSDNFLHSLPLLPKRIHDIIVQSNYLDSLPNLPVSLERLVCDNNRLYSLPPIPSQLKELFCGNNFIHQLPTLPTTIIRLECWVNPIHSLPNPLPPNIIDLECSNDSLSVLPNLPNSLQTLIFSSNNIHYMPNLPSSLKQLDCESNPLYQLPIILPKNLIDLYCGGDSLTALPILPDSLKNLSCIQNNILCLPKLPAGLTSFYFDTIIHCLPNAIHPNLYSSNFPSTPLCSSTNPNSCPLFSGISGKLYLDYNQNCVDDSSDEVISNVNVRLLDTANNVLQTTNTNVGGWYSFNVTPTQKFIIKVDTASVPFHITCPLADTLQANITTTDSIAANKNFAFNCPNGFDVGVQSIYANTDFNPTHNTTLNIAAGNLFKRFGVSGCSSGTTFNIAVKMSGKVHYQANAGLIAPTFISANNDSLYWSNVAMGADLYNSFIINCKTDSTANAGDVVCFYANVTPTSGDIDSLNNNASQCFVVTTSHDPNYKEVSPINAEAFKQEWLTYTIHFQNTGTAPAHNINVLDTLDSNLEPGTITLLNSSHPTIMQTVGNVARFIFANINLPDSTQDKLHSNGFVQFKIKHKPNLPQGTNIKNTGYIYFDYNSAVVTNTTETKNIVTGINVVIANNDLKIYPNPTNHSTVISLQYAVNHATIQLINLLGETVLTKTNQSGNQFILDLVNQPQGIYFIEVLQQGNVWRGKVVKE